MLKRLQNKAVIFFTILFMAIISAPLVIMSFDDSIDIAFFFGENEEEEKEGLKLLFEITPQDLESFFSDLNNFGNIGYTFKTYPKPHLNLIVPPPEFI